MVNWRFRSSHPELVNRGFMATSGVMAKAARWSLEIALAAGGKLAVKILEDKASFFWEGAAAGRKIFHLVWTRFRRLGRAALFLLEQLG